MPRKSKRSISATKRENQRNSNPLDSNKYSTLKFNVHSMIRGTFHQGDFQVFSSESVGRQCSCNAVVMLCIVDNIFECLMPCHLDQVLTIGDRVYKDKCQELEACEMLAADMLLDQTQLPDYFKYDGKMYTIDYKHENFRHGKVSNECSQSELSSCFQHVFTVSDKQILILDGYMMAIYKRKDTGQFLFFDSHSRDENGLVAAQGTSVALIFTNIHSLLIYLSQLIQSLRSKYFAVLPVVVHVQPSMQVSPSNENLIINKVYQPIPQTINDKQSASLLNCDDIPGCSTWNDSSSVRIFNDTLGKSDEVNTSSRKRILRREKTLSRKRQLSNKLYQNPEIAAKKRRQARQTSKDAYQDPKKAQQKRQQARKTSKDAYQDPKKAQQKQQQARKTSKDAYQDPKKAQRKRQQARKISKDAYQDPEKAQRKRQQARKTYKDAYQEPKKAQQERQRARKTSKDAYQDPKKAQRKRQQARKISKDAYQDPEKAQRKRQQARKTSKDAYQNPKKAQRKRQQARRKSKKAYQNPEIRVTKINQCRSYRASRQSNIDKVIADFQKSCQKDQLLIYVCVICQRVHFKHQGQTFKKGKYNERILVKCFLPGITIDSSSDSKGKDDALWICNTCHQNIYVQKIVPRLALVNKLNLHEQPPQLLQLNMLERHLIAPAIPFMKMIPLIKGAQKGIHGQVVCVKADINNTAKCLPRLPTDESLIRVKLKRKLQYKGHHMCQDVNPTKVKEALAWLKDNNANYDDIVVDFQEFDSLLNDQLMQDEHTLQDDHLTENVSESLDVLLNDDVNNNDTSKHQSHHKNITAKDAIEAAIATRSCQYHEQIENNDDFALHVENIENGPVNDYEVLNDEGEDNLNLDNNDQDSNDDITNTSAPLYSFLHPSDFAQYLADKHDESILSVAPGEGNKPQKVIEMESTCFPVEFPQSTNTYKEQRKQKLSLSRYFNSRLFSADNRFARNPEYIFFALYTKEVEQFHSSVSIAIRTGSTKTASGQEITASMLRDKEQVKKLLQRDEGYRFMQKIRGTPAFWEQSKRDLFAMIRQLGLPTWFVTFSAADRRWKELHDSLLISDGKTPMTEEEHKNMTWEQHCQIIMSNPVSAARVFQERVRVFIKDVIMSKAGPIGNVQDYFYRTEFQQRGWPHIHMVAWVENAPRFGEDPDDEVIQFIDKYISCEIPPESDEQLREIVTSVQTHSKNHTKSCRKGRKTCRFNFPRPPSNRTFISQPPEPVQINEDDPRYQEAMDEMLQKETEAKDKLKKVWELLAETDDETEWDDILDEVGISQDDFESYLSKVSQKQTIYLKRRAQDQWINNYNPHLIRCWNGNMDIQYVLDAYACAMYIVSYINKAEKEMGDLLKNAQREAAEGNEEATQQLRKLGSVYIQNREISVMGAIYMICSMPLRESTRNVIFLQTDSDGQKISLPLKQLQENAGNSEQVWMPTHIEKYINRPKSAKYNNMCMAKFFSNHYQVSCKVSTNLDEGTDIDTDMRDQYDTDRQTSHDPSHNNDNENNSNYQVSVSKQHSSATLKQSKGRTGLISIDKCNVKMKERTKGKPAVIRYPRVSVKKDSERYHMNMLRLYLPHRNEEIKPTEYLTYQSYHLTGDITINGKSLQVKDLVKENMEDFEPKTDDLDQAWDALRDAIDLTDAWSALNPQAEQQRLDDIIDRVNLDDSEDDYAEIQIPEFQRSHTSHPNDGLRCAIESCNPQITQEQAHLMMQKLNSKQRQVFNFVSKWCDDKARDLTVKPFHIFLTGGAGTGKSHVINCIKYYASTVFAPITESADQVTVLLLAHTGTAAFNISGQTICSALKIPAKSSQYYTPLSEESLNTLRSIYQHLQLVIIDEISMVSVTQLRYIHGRLQQVKGTSHNSYFGNVSILAVGDFYQLPPVSPPTPLCFPHEENLKDLWNNLFQKVELTEIMRQRDDAVFAKMLNRLRVRKQTEPLQEMDIKLLESRIVKENGVEAPSDALHLFFTNKDVDNHNETKIASLNTEIHTLKAQDVDQVGGRIIDVCKTPHLTSRKDDTSLVPYLKLCVGARVMLIANVDVSDGLCNGVSGIIKGIVFTNSELPSVVYVKFDNNRIGTKAQTSQFIQPEYAGCVPIKPRKEIFKIKKSKGKNFTTTREQIPLKLAWAVTIHKVQGQTTDQAVISMKGLRAAMAYVALSRVTSLEGLYFIDFDLKRIFCNPDIETNIAKINSFDMSIANRLLNIDNRKNFIIVHHNIRSLQCHIEDLKTNTQLRKAHVICLSETWLTEDNHDFTHLAIDGYTLETVNAGKYRSVAIYVQNSVNYSVLPILSNACDTLAIRTYGATDMTIIVVYKPPNTAHNVFVTEMNEITAQTELLESDRTIFAGDFNINLMKPNVLQPRCFQNFHQVITEPTTTSNTLIDHIYIKPHPGVENVIASTLPTYHSNHYPVFIAIRLRD